MIKPTLLLITVLILAGCTTPTLNSPTAQTKPVYPETARTFALNPAASQVGYEVDEQFGINSGIVLGRKQATGEATTIGTTSALTGTLTIDFGTSPPALLNGRFTADIRTLKTEYAHRDAILRTAWLESNKFPVATFIPTEISSLPTQIPEGEPFTFDLNGDITIRDISLPVTLPTTAVLTANELTASATLPLSMSDFGFTPPSMINVVEVNNDFLLFIEITAQSD